MPRLMSVAMTTDAVIERRKTVSRRIGWWEDKNGRRLLHAGDRLTLCRKVQGRTPCEPLDRLAEVEVVDVRREPLRLLWDWEQSPQSALYATREVGREGFPGMGPALFVHTYFVQAQELSIDAEVTRIEWRYLCDECPDERSAVIVNGHALCVSCHHDALRSGWEPG